MPGVAIVTGAARGIGRAIACRLVRDGFKVALNDLPSQRSELEALRSDLSRSGNETFVSHADVSVEGEVKAMINDVVSNMGGLDVVCPSFPSEGT
jgi:NAD(P)-dependent dehydrogenase (short-subunit alcohol dehydrogenase family)